MLRHLRSALRGKSRCRAHRTSAFTSGLTLGRSRLTKDFCGHGHDEGIGTREGALDRRGQADRPRHVVPEHIDELVCERAGCGELAVSCAAQQAELGMTPTDSGDAGEFVLQVARVDEREAAGVDLAVRLVERFRRECPRTRQDLWTATAGESAELEPCGGRGNRSELAGLT